MADPADARSPHWRRALTASFVATLAVSCQRTSGAPPAPHASGEGSHPEGHHRTGISRGPAGTCRLVRAADCPPEVHCNPPPPVEIDCPPALRQGPQQGTNDDHRPPGKEGWLRVRRQFAASSAGCQYRPDRLCPPDPGAACEVGDALTVPCQERGGMLHIEAFQAPRSGGRCARYPAFQCRLGERCRLPEPRACAEPGAVPDAP